MAAAIVSAQKCGLSLREWLDRVVASLIADDHPEGAAPWSVLAADLFADVANCSPELLHGRWALLYEHALLDETFGISRSKRRKRCMTANCRGLHT